MTQSRNSIWLNLSYVKANFSESTTESWLRQKRKLIFQNHLHENVPGSFSKCSHLCHLPKTTEITFYLLQMLLVLCFEKQNVW
jgi:hypothetical protein